MREEKKMQLKDKYAAEVIPALKEKFGYANPMQVPRLTKISLSIGVGDARENSAYLERAQEELLAIACQKPLVIKAKKAVSNFKLRIGYPIAVSVTLRGKMMWNFLEKLFGVALPRVRDFRGLKRTAFDGRGNYNLGLTEQLIFPEVDFDRVAKVRGMNVAICTTAKNDKEAEALLEGLGCPFKN
jgi:large subunit ribosomal protein L5